MRFRHTAVDDVTGTPVSELAVRSIDTLGVNVTITVADPDVPRVHHWLTPVAVAELVKALQATQRPVIPMRP
jgi:hypothetical protein